jgi:hypothetical protein
MIRIAVDPSPSVEQFGNVKIESDAVLASESEINVLDESLLAIVGGGDGIVCW